MSGAPRLRRAVERDLTAIARIERESFSDPWSEASFRSTLAHPQVIATVIEQGGAVRGYSIAWIVGDEAELANLAVAPEVRRGGLGRRLLDALLGEVAARGGASIHLEVREGNVAAQALYRSRGFEVVGRRKAYYQAPEEDAVIMRRPHEGPDEGPR
jgi:ribosomal-protein-alanine N-acetyltransferase